MDGLNIVRSFRENFYSLVSQIPEGRLTTYGELAKALGDKIAARAVGTMLNQNPRPEEVPCHRVVTYDGKIGGYDKGVEKKKELLKDEGIEIKDEKIKDFQNVLFKDFDSAHPLRTLRKIQKDFKDKVVLENLNDDFKYVAGVDVSYYNLKAYPALSLWSRNTEEKTYSSFREVTFPYIPTYLAFREIPPILDVLDKCKIEPDVIMVDGNGILHPNKTGLATHLGLETDIPTIGVAKSKLCGTLMNKVDRKNRVSSIHIDEELVGYAVLEGSRATNPIYVSSGYGISIEKSLEIVRDHCTYKVPDPIRSAHMVAKKLREKDG